MSESNDGLQELLIQQHDHLWREAEEGIRGAAEDNSKNRIVVKITHVITLDGPQPSVETTLSFRDKRKRGKLNVAETVSISVGGKTEDQAQGQLFGSDETPADPEDTVSEMPQEGETEEKPKRKHRKQA